MRDEKITCTRCQKRVRADKEVWLELDNTTGEYLQQDVALPAGHQSQGWFVFGADCAKHPNKEYSA